jgi:type III restriction enzyme
MTTLKQDYDTLSKMGLLFKDIPEIAEKNLNPSFKLRPYQKEAILRFIHYFEDNPNRLRPTQLLFHMATGSGKTLLMAANILYLYSKGYRNFLFFVNSTNIIEKTKENFLNPNSSKYLFNEKITVGDREVKIANIDNFDESNNDDINIIFTTVQGLHSFINNPKENTLTYEDFKDKKTVFISDEAHHINAWTRNSINKQEMLEKNTWEYTINNLFKSNSENVMLEYTATVDLDTPAIYDKYQNKIIYDYSLKQFRLDGYSKEVKVLQADLDNVDRMLQAVVLSQYRRKIGARNRIHLKPVILFKSKSIKESEKNLEDFQNRIRKLKAKDIENVCSQSKENVLENAFKYFKKENISFENLTLELKEDFSEEKCMLLDSNNIDEEKQLKLNSLENDNNETRAIFAVDMLNEGWDVLNLFDIVRLYDTRDSKGNKPGKTTIAEAQLIGRGARYFPFKLTEDDDKYKRKLDQEPTNDLKIIEELYYHSSYNPRYIQELKTALRETGIMPPQEPLLIHLRVKEKVKETNFWKNGVIFVNNKISADRSKIKNINDIEVSKIFGPYKLRSGATHDRAIFSEESPLEEDKILKQFEVGNFRSSIMHKARSKLDFYKFENLKKYFPSLNSMNEFTGSLEQIKVDLRSSNARLSNLSSEDKLEVCLKILNELELQVKAGYTEYKGTKIFVPKKVKEIVEDKILEIHTDDFSDKEFGVAMSKARKDELRLNLSKKEWYVYDENYGTSEEKHFIQFVNGIIDKLEGKYSEVYLLSNANLFKIYRFSDGKAIVPDFVLLLKKKSSSIWLQYQLFVEAKGTHLLKTDEWKEQFLKEIESNFKLETIHAEDTNFRLIGMPFYNEDSRHNFIEVFDKKLGLND